MSQRMESLRAAARSPDPKAALRALSPTREELAALRRWVDRYAPETRTTRFGVEVVLDYWPAEDPTCRWQVTCVHGRCCGWATKTEARAALAHPDQFCPWCAAVRDGSLTLADAALHADQDETAPY